MEKIHELEKVIGQLYYCILHSSNTKSANILKRIQEQIKLELLNIKNK